MTVKEYDNDQIDYLVRVAEQTTNYWEEWAARDGFIMWQGQQVVLTEKGQDFLDKTGWHVEPRQVIESYPDPVLIPPVVPTVTPVAPIVAAEAPKEEPKDE